VGHIDEISDRYLDQFAALDPISATHSGLTGHDDAMTDYSPEGFAALAELNELALAQLDAVAPADANERVAKEALQERLGIGVEIYDAGIVTSELNVVAGPLHDVRGAFDLMPLAGEEAARNIAVRMAAVPNALRQLARTFTEAAAHGHVAAQRQILKVADQCDNWAAADRDNFWPDLAARVVAAGGEAGTPVADSLAADLDRAAAAARAATAEFATFLRTELAPLGRDKEAVGRERYQLASRYFLGSTVDLDETYAWGFEELARLRAEMATVADKIMPGSTREQAIEALDTDPARRIEGREEFREWMQQLSDRTLAAVNGTHFDIPEQVRVLECHIAPVSDGGIYYTGPSEDFSRPGRMWWAVPTGKNSFATWQEVSVVYHEGVPGHHLQVAQTAVRKEMLNRWRRYRADVSGHGEGWALYAERLMEELGYLDEPGEKMGLLDSQSLRATRVIIDIGMHLELEIPRDNPLGFHPGERFTPELGWELLRANSSASDGNLQFEINRYLGWPGQAPSYKIGERVWLQARAEAKARQGANFDLKAFHRAALDLGPLGLDPLRAALSRI
jgi:uncharacterized protein (DUF885 family)